MRQLSNWYRQSEHCGRPLLKQHISQGYWKGFKVDWTQKACWCHLNTIVFAKTYFYVYVSVGILDFLQVRWTKKSILVDSLVMEILVWTLYFVTPKYSDCMQYYTMLLKQCDHILLKVQATVTWMGEDHINVYSVTWLDYSFAFT